MELSELRPLTTRLRPVEPARVDRAEEALGCRFPAGYRELVTRFGEGTTGGFLRIYPPDRVLETRAEWQARVREYWFWETGGTGTTPDRIREGVVVADSFDGDELCFHPEDPDTLYLLPRHFDDAIRLGPGLLAALDWMLGSGELVVRESGPVTFEPWHDRTEIRRYVSGDLAEVAAELAAHDPGALVVPAHHSGDGFASGEVLLPAIGGHALLWWFADGSAEVMLSHDASAPEETVRRVTGVVEARARQ